MIESWRVCCKIICCCYSCLKEGFVDVLVTAPINKYNIQSEDFKFPGHRLFRSRIREDALMLMVKII
jgi:4-hydroxy-L-threonine phosphate dehydrogenase PdxA